LGPGSFAGRKTAHYSHRKMVRGKKWTAGKREQNSTRRKIDKKNKGVAGRIRGG